jgi:type I site-specific restriction-modification system R (restriction) subunit
MHLGQTISRYMVLIASEQKLLMMRPYQVYAVKPSWTASPNCGNGYIWHTTGSGKTLTSFKASTLLKDNPDIEKCLFVVDRKDLDRQTREEFNKFQEGCVEENTNTGALVRRLLSDDYADKVIVTTIQKLGLALDENSKRNKQQKKNGQPDLQGAARRCATNASSSSSTSATAPSSARTTGHQRVLPQGPALRLHRHAHLRGQCQPSARSRASRPHCAPP